MDRIHVLESEIAEIRKTLYVKEKELYELKKRWNPLQNQTAVSSNNQSTNFVYNSGVLPKWAIERYSRQILLQEIGVQGQQKLCSARVLIVGAGGLGCPAAMYLAGAGVGELGIIDYDTVDLTNIHRQILHGEDDENMNKVDSAANKLRSINSHITITPYNLQLSSTNAMNIVSKYDLVLDCTDNVPSRYLLNDVCVLNKIPLISGSALKMEGQITIYGYKDKNTEKYGPCYRCVFPSPPPAAAVGSCSANGVAGPLPAVIGAMQALETMKYISGFGWERLLVERMVLFDGDDCTFRTVKLRPKDPNCAICSSRPTITHLVDYETFCKAQAKEKKRQEARLKAQKRKEEKQRRMTGRSYLGFRITEPEGKRKWIQDVLKSERKLGIECRSQFCINQENRHCDKFAQKDREEIFNHFWNDLTWVEKKGYVKSLIDIVPLKRRRVKIKGEVSRKKDSKVYNLFLNDKKVPVCRVMFLNTLGIKEATVRCWLIKENVPKVSKKPIKTLNVHSYIDTLPKTEPKCQFCKQNVQVLYINLDNVKNVFQLYFKYVEDMKNKGETPASRKTFTKAFAAKKLKIFKPKNDTDICDINPQHNLLPINDYNNLEVIQDKDLELDNVATVNYYYQNVQW